jgi:hypothetical protein
MMPDNQLDFTKFPFYKERKPTTSELDFFRRSSIPGYAAEDGSVVINPVPSAGINYDAVRLNEYVRQLIKHNRIKKPNFQITNKQRLAFKEYGDEEDILSTIAARIVSNDPSAGDVTEDQKKYAYEIWDFINAR